jgi:hypothetical protein
MMVLLTVLVAAPAVASDERKAPAVTRSPCEHAEPEDYDLLDATTHLLGDSMCIAARWLDGLFGERGQISAGYTTGGVLEVSGTYSEFYGADLQVRLNARVRLPALERRLSVFVGRENEEEVARDRTEGFGLRSLFRALDEPVDWFAGLGYDVDIFEGVRSDSRIGVRSVSDPQLFVQQRVVVDLLSDPLSLVQLRATPFWNTRDGFGFTGNFDANRVLSNAFLLRWGTAGTITEHSKGVDWRSALVLYQDLGAWQGLAYELFIRGLSEHPVPITEYGARLIHRLPVARKRLFIVSQASYSWPLIDPQLSRQGAWGVGLGLEIPLDAGAASQVR